MSWKVRGVGEDFSIDAFPTPDPEEPEPVRLVVHLVESKTDPFAEGQRVFIPRSSDRDWLNCPLRLLRELYAFSRGKSVFEELREHHAPHGLTQNTMAGIFHRALTAAGLSSARLERLSLHSFRRGGASAAAALGVSILEIKTIGRWKSDVAFLYALVSDQQASRASQDLLASVTAGLKG